MACYSHVQLLSTKLTIDSLPFFPSWQVALSRLTFVLVRYVWGSLLLSVIDHLSNISCGGRPQKAGLKGTVPLPRIYDT